MSNDVNKCIFTGRLTRDPEVRATSGGSKVVNVGLANNKSWKDKNTDQWKEKVTFIELQAWNGQGDKLSSYGKGDYLYVECSYELRSWEDSEGNKRTTPQFTVLDSKRFITAKAKESSPEEDDEETQAKPTTKKRGRPAKEKVESAPTKPVETEDEEEDSIPF